MIGFIVAGAASVAGIIYGAFLFAGNKACYSVLCGADSFLSLDPSDAELRTSARQSAVAVWLVVLALWCAVVRSYVSLSEGVDAAVLVVGIAAGVAVAIIIVLQIVQYARVLRRNRGR